jgi:RNA polymerase sigma factor (TIGR02999 family)
VQGQPKNVTALLNAWGAGDQNAGNELMTLVYQELRKLAASYLKAERTDHTLQPTALVHELYLKWFSAEPVQWNNRGHFLAVAACQLRRLVVDYARRERAQKRGGNGAKLSLDDAPELSVPLDARVIELDEALKRFEKLDLRAAQVVELRFFGGLTESEVAQSLDISPATVKRDWDFARTWLMRDMQ